MVKVTIYKNGEEINKALDVVIKGKMTGSIIKELKEISDSIVKEECADEVVVSAKGVIVYRKGKGKYKINDKCYIVLLT